MRPTQLMLLLLPSVANCMDFKGQLHCERAFQITVVAFGIVGFIVGYLQQEFRLTFYFLATGGGISAVLCLPDWPWWNRHPLEWREAPDEEEDEDEAPPNPTTFAGGWPLPALRLQPMMAEPEPRTQAEGEMDEESLFHGIRKAKRGMEGAVPDKNAPPSDALAADGAALSPLGAGVLVTTCGHAVHLHCWQDYMSGLLRRVAAAESFEGEGQVRPQRGEFLCPVCRGLSNSVVPLCAREDRTTRGAPPDEAEVAKIASPEVEITSKAPAEAEAALGAAGGSRWTGGSPACHDGMRG